MLESPLRLVVRIDPIRVWWIGFNSFWNRQCVMQQARRPDRVVLFPSVRCHGRGVLTHLGEGKILQARFEPVLTHGCLGADRTGLQTHTDGKRSRSEEHTSELQSRD